MSYAPSSRSDWNCSRSLAKSRIVPIGLHPDDGEDMPVLPFPASCPRQSGEHADG